MGLGKAAAKGGDRGEADGTRAVPPWRRAASASSSSSSSAGGRGGEMIREANGADYVRSHHVGFISRRRSGAAHADAYADADAESCGFAERGRGQSLGSTGGAEAACCSAAPARRGMCLKSAPTCRKSDGTLLVLILLVAFLGTGVDGVHECAWQYNNLKWDLGSLVHHRPQRDYAIDRGGWIFHLNVCSDTVRIPRVCRDTLPDVIPAPGYQTFSKNGEETCYIMGDINTGIWGLLDEGRPQEGLKLTYSAGTKCDARTGRSIEYHFVCNPEAPEDAPPTTVAGECRFMVIWPTPLACPAYQSAGAGLGIGFGGLGIFVVGGIVLYFVGSFAYNVVKLGKKMDMFSVPHADSLMAMGRFVAEKLAKTIGYLRRGRSSTPRMSEGLAGESLKRNAGYASL